MTTVTVRTPALMDRLRIQSLLRKITDTHGEARMLELLSQALEVEFQRQDRAKYSYVPGDGKENSSHGKRGRA